MSSADRRATDAADPRASGSRRLFDRANFGAVRDFGEIFLTLAWLLSYPALGFVLANLGLSSDVAIWRLVGVGVGLIWLASSAWPPPWGRASIAIPVSGFSLFLGCWLIGAVVMSFGEPGVAAERLTVAACVLAALISAIAGSAMWAASVGMRRCGRLGLAVSGVTVCVAALLG